jgi:outer membrane protein assembly factor BamB
LSACLALAGFAVAGMGVDARAADWPAYHHDMSRSGATDETLALPLSAQWVVSSPTRPRAAWDEPATWDGYNKVFGMRNRQEFDKALHVVSVGENVYFGSSVTDSVTCLDSKTGKARWNFYTEGPVRLAPQIHQGRVYFGCDDGLVYCLDAKDGGLIWKRRPAPEERRLPGNGRLISAWAIRSGVLVDGDVVYCCAGVIPAEKVYVCALGAEDGQPLWRTAMEDYPAQGYLLASPTRLYVTTGRNKPLVFDRAGGKRLYQISGGGGGTYALLTGDTLLYGPGKSGQVSLHGDGRGDQIASFSGNHMIVSQGMSYLHDERELSALDRTEYLRLTQLRAELIRRKQDIVEQLKKSQGETATKLAEEMKAVGDQIDQCNSDRQTCVRWKVECDCPHSMILAGDKLFCGGLDRIAAFSTQDGSRLWEAPLAGRVYGLAVANGRLWASTDHGAIHCFAPGDDSAPAATAADKLAPPERPRVKIPRSHEGPAKGFHGPFIEPSEGDTLVVRWWTHEPRTSELEWNRNGRESSESLKQEGFRTEHTFHVPRHDDDYFYRLTLSGADSQGNRLSTPQYEIDGTLRYAQADADATATADANTSATSDDPNSDDKNSNKRNPTEESVAAGASDISGTPDTLLNRAAEAALSALGSRRGYAVVAGATDGRFIERLVRGSQLQVIVLEPDGPRARALREKFARQGLHGWRVSVHQVRPGRLPYGPYFANLVTSEVALASGQLPPWLTQPLAQQSDPAEDSPGETSGPRVLDALLDLVRPAGGVICLATDSAQIPSEVARKSIQTIRDRLSPDWGTELTASSDTSDKPGVRTWLARRAALPGAGQWTHQYGDADNSSCSKDELVQGSLSVLWWGRPGSRPMPDRGPRNPAPVSAGGRLYVQGDRTLFALDAYNGTILWFKQIPTMRRANMPRDGSNMVASQQGVYLALAEHCLLLDGDTGRVLLDVRVQDANAKPGQDATATQARQSAAENNAAKDVADGPLYDWGYIAAVGQTLLGSATKRGSQYLGDRGEWFEDYKQGEVARVTSDNLFAVDPRQGDLRWNYRRGVILNSTITIAGETVYFIESRNPAALAAKTNQLLEEIQSDQYLVALELKSGKPLWEKPFDFSQCQYMTYMAASGGTLIVTGSDSQKNFHTYAFDAPFGEALWQHHTSVLKGHHSGQLSHPAIVGDKVYLNKHTYNLRSGEVLDVSDFNWHGCGVTSASMHTLFRRYEYLGMQDLHSLERTELLGLRSGCWLSLIPSGGVLLAPETSSGCSCDHALQTSIAYVPTKAIRPQGAAQPAADAPPAAQP